MYKVFPIFSKVTYIKWKSRNDRLTQCDRLIPNAPHISWPPGFYSTNWIYSVVKYVTAVLKEVRREVHFMGENYFGIKE